MKQAYSTLLRILVLSGLLYSCEKKIDLELDPNYNILVVEGYLTNIPARNFVKLSLAQPYNQQDLDRGALDDARVVLFEDETEVHTLNFNTESERYEYPDGFLPEVGKNYQLEIVTGGRTFRSDEEDMLPLAPIDSSYLIARKQLFFGKDSVNLYTPYLHSVDPNPEKKNHYRIRGAQLPTSDDFLEDIVVFNDDFLQVAPDGKSIVSSQPITDDQIDEHLEYVESTDSLVNLQLEYWHIQSSYEEFLLLLDQTDFAGSPYDPPAPAVRGNIKEVRNDGLQIWAQGHFAVAAIDSSSVSFRKMEE